MLNTHRLDMNSSQKSKLELKIDPNELIKNTGS